MSGDHNQHQKPEYVDRRQWKYDPMTGNRLAQFEPEPVAWYYAGSDIECASVALDADLDEKQKANCTPLYTAPPRSEPTKLLLIPALMEQAGWVRKREWQGLTAKDLAEIPPSCFEGAIWADARLKEKNT
jgi:hypothetical protein